MRDATLVTALGRDPENNDGIVNPPIQRASTILFPSVEALLSARPGPGVVNYGRYGTPTTFALEEAVAGLEGAGGAVALASGKAAIVATLLALLKAGDHILVADNVYHPTRQTVEGILARMGVSHDFFDPLDPEDVQAKLRPQTRMVYIESPGSLTFEVCDVPAIARIAHGHGALVVFDNTWGTPIFFKPYEHGVDATIHAATKYIGGHSDLMMGIVTSTPELHPRLRSGIQDLGMVSSPEDCWLALRGLRTLDVRLQRHMASGIEIARWLQARPEVSRVLHPALPDDPSHALWRRDFKGASGLFGIVLKRTSAAAVAAMLDGMSLFGMGWSWGGYESLLIPTFPQKSRSAAPWQAEGPCLRIHVGLEAVEDLIIDLEAGFERLQAAG
ncbi:MAG TPA: cystathionine beta-lyase [Geminicoccus sp.]|jgi:cystathionine beta-lyase|uniref:cystathionine beta-lyase n=1 Tax=Geminicoccus sp. TaxID=2024832 RepID=UPI002E351C96|nr:cystathionine beta-lyase [Geminicoccus sp.]HEX2526831.1 cystathionine beta-lyase [Geminicoccus sp.]